MNNGISLLRLLMNMLEEMRSYLDGIFELVTPLLGSITDGADDLFAKVTAAANAVSIRAAVTSSHNRTPGIINS